MAHWQPFGATNQPDTCLWCGRVPPWRVDKAFAQAHEDGRRGGYGDGYFCGLRCAYQFACVLAKNGRRLAPSREA